MNIFLFIIGVVIIGIVVNCFVWGGCIALGTKTYNTVSKYEKNLSVDDRLDWFNAHRIENIMMLVISVIVSCLTFVKALQFGNYVTILLYLVLIVSLKKIGFMGYTQPMSFANRTLCKLATIPLIWGVLAMLFMGTLNTTDEVCTTKVTANNHNAEVAMKQYKSAVHEKAVAEMSGNTKMAQLQQGNADKALANVLGAKLGQNVNAVNGIANNKMVATITGDTHFATLEGARYNAHIADMMNRIVY